MNDIVMARKNSPNKQLQIVVPIKEKIKEPAAAKGKQSVIISPQKNQLNTLLPI